MVNDKKTNKFSIDDDFIYDFNEAKNKVTRASKKQYYFLFFLGNSRLERLKSKLNSIFLFLESISHVNPKIIFVERDDSVIG